MTNFFENYTCIFITICCLITGVKYIYKNYYNMSFGNILWCVSGILLGLWLFDYFTLNVINKIGRISDFITIILLMIFFSSPLIDQYKEMKNIRDINVKKRNRISFILW